MGKFREAGLRERNLDQQFNSLGSKGLNVGKGEVECSIHSGSTSLRSFEAFAGKPEKAVRQRFSEGGRHSVRDRRAPACERSPIPQGSFPEISASPAEGLR